MASNISQLPGNSGSSGPQDATVNESRPTAAAASFVPASAPPPPPSARSNLTDINTLPLSRWFWGHKERSFALDGSKFPRWLGWSSYAVTVHTKHMTEWNSAPKPILCFRISDIQSVKASIVSHTDTLLVSISLHQGRASHLKSTWLNSSDDDVIIFKFDGSAADCSEDHIKFVNMLNIRTQGCMTLISGEDARVLEREGELRARHYKSLGLG